MTDTSLYQRIAEHFRQEILAGRIQPGDRLPPIRELTRSWNCTPGTVQRAYQELARQGLVQSSPGRGTLVSGRPPEAESGAREALRRATLVHQAETFLLEGLAAGYAPAQIRQAVDQALDRWRAAQAPQPAAAGQSLRFAGSHDSVVAWLANHFSEIAPGVELQAAFSGSLAGLMALAEGRADLAGCHLWDPESRTYNLPFIRRLFPGVRVAVIRLADRRLGWILPAGNPQGFARLEDLTRPGLRFANRQRGSGTRVWLDQALAESKILPAEIQGYAEEKTTHFEVARSVAEGRVDVGLGLEAAAEAFGLAFRFAVLEAYDLVVPAAGLERPALRALVDWLASPAGRAQVGAQTGYDSSASGALTWV